jgi:hypothetical protein
MRRAARGRGRPLCLLLLSIALAAVPAFGSGQGFDGLVSRLVRQLAIAGTKAPATATASFSREGFAHGGVKAIRLTRFEDVRPGVTPAALDSALRRDLGKPWQPLVKVLNRDARKGTFVYARLGGGELFLIVADLRQGSLSLVQLHLDRKRMAAWAKDPQGFLKHVESGR